MISKFFLLPPWKGARGMFIPNGLISKSVRKAEPMKHPPTPFVRGIWSRCIIKSKSTAGSACLLPTLQRT